MAHAEIELAYVLVGEQALRRPVVNDAPVLHDVAVARDGQRGGRVLLDEQYRQPQLVPQARDQGHEALDDQRRQAERELVDQQHGRPVAGAPGNAARPPTICASSAPRKPEIARSVVVLPAPLVPSSATIEPESTRSDTPWIAVATWW